MVGHHDKRMKFPSVRPDRALQPMQPLLAIRIITDDGTALIPSRHHVIESTGILDLEGSYHGMTVPPWIGRGKHYSLFRL